MTLLDLIEGAQLPLRVVQNADLVAVERLDGTIECLKDRFGESNTYPSLQAFDAYVKSHGGAFRDVRVFHERTFDWVKVEPD